LDITRQEFEKQYPGFKTGITPVKSANSLMSSEERNGLINQKMRQEEAAKMFKKIDIEKIQ